MADTIANAVTVPVQAIVEREGQNYCYVLPSNGRTAEIRRVQLGASNDKMVAIEKDTLKVGERVVQNLASVINEEELAARAKEDAETYKVATPVLTVQKAPAASGAAAPGAGNGLTASSGGAATAGGAAKTPGKTGGAGLMQYDTNGDGKISIADEVPEDRRGFLTRLDQNSDGTIDADELAALRARGQQGGGGGGPSGGAGGFTMPATGGDWIKASDKNGDGKVAKDELPEFAQGFFGTMDTDSDGFVDLPEADALIQRMKQMQQQGGFGGGGGAGGPPGGQ
jgi:hypothetical protein